MKVDRVKKSLILRVKSGFYRLNFRWHEICMYIYVTYKYKKIMEIKINDNYYYF